MEKTTTTKKFREFISEPMKDKHVSKLAGIGDVLGKRLEDAGFDKASKVLGQFLVLKKDEKLFQQWLKDTCKASSKQSGDCYKCLKEYCDAFL